MKKLTRFVLFLIVLAGALAFLKPTEKDFEEWVKKDFARKREKVDENNIIDQLAEKGINKATELQVLGSYQYSNHFVAARVDAWANLQKVRYLGVAGLWIKLPGE
ncbi:MAG TPA: hypothetical protein PLK12_12840 [Prolixibacteraceae bacterium]|nr:hypothetical protein [Prolixibacteraceae bacterium]